jgi:ribose-phosphate pyrophosphokinase
MFECPLLFCGSSHKALGHEIAKCLNVKLGRLLSGCFTDGEINVEILDQVRNRDVFLLQTIALKTNDYLMELLITVDALKRASAKSVTVVIPYFGYCRQDRKDRPHVPITAKLVANLLTAAGVSRILTIDLHAPQVEGFFDIPVDHLFARVALSEAFKEYRLKNFVVVAPDIGSVKIARSIALHLNAEMAIVDKDRVSPTEVSNIVVIGDVKGKDVLLADDMCTTGGTLVSAAKACQEKGARRIFAIVTHGVFVGQSVEKIQESPIEAILTTNTIPYTDRLKGFAKLKVVTIAPLIAHGIQYILSANKKDTFE